MISKILYKMYHAFLQPIEVWNLVFGYTQTHQILMCLYTFIKLYVFPLFVFLYHYK